MLFLYCVSVLVAVFKIQVAFSVLSFEASSNYVEKGSPFILTCHVTPLTGILQFIKNGSVVGSCSPPLVGLAPGTCSLAAIKQNISTENTTWNISSASFSTHNGTWKCVHLTETGETLVMITDLAKGITNNDASLPPNPDSNTEYKAFVECSYPKPIIKWTLRECRGTNNNIDVKDNPSVIEDPSTCTYPAQKYSSSIKVSSMASPGSVPKCYEPLATLYYSFASSAPLQIQSNVSFSLPGVTTTVFPTSTNANGMTTERPLLPDCNWICKIKIIVPIVAAVILLIVIITCCVRYRHKCIETNETKQKKSTDVTAF